MKTATKKISISFLILFLLLVLLLVLYQPSDEMHPLLKTSPAQPVTNYQTFAEYVKKTKQLITENRYFLTDDHEKEIAANLPFEVKPQTPQKNTNGILLIHGLGDSPWSFVDIAQALSKRGFLVRTILLSGHGTKPGDLLHTDYREWKAMVTKQTQMLKAEVDNVYLGGFSTGGNLAYIQAVKDPDIKGLVLFSPGFEPVSRLLFLAPFLSFIKPWILKVNYNATNYVRYMRTPTNGYAQFYYTVREVRNDLKKNFNRPVFMVLAEHDSVLGVYKIRKLFTQRFTHPDSHLIWFGSQPSETRGNITTVNSYNPQYRISNMSHMSILFSPENPYYGIKGTHRICHNGQTSEDEQACKTAEEVWYSAWGYRESGKIHARATFNPEFDLMINSISRIFHF